MCLLYYGLISKSAIGWKTSRFQWKGGLIYPNGYSLPMNQQPLGPKIITLSVLIALGIVYSAFLYFHPTLTGGYVLDGIIGVVLGLYISSHPAAHLVEMLFYGRAMRYSFSSKRSFVLW